MYVCVHSDDAKDDNVDDDDNDSDLVITIFMSETKMLVAIVVEIHL
jgi:hypothetical protein